MSEDLLIRHCSPTLAGIKIENLFSCPFSSQIRLTNELYRLNKKLLPKGICVLPLRVRKGSALIYVYRPHSLVSNLRDQYAKALLLNYGYLASSPNKYLAHFIEKL